MKYFDKKNTNEQKNFFHMLLPGESNPGPQEPQSEMLYIQLCQNFRLVLNAYLKAFKTKKNI